MNSKTAWFRGVFIVSAVAGGLTCVASPGPAMSQEAGEVAPPAAPAEDTAPAAPMLHATPEACFEAAKTAFNARDWRGFVACVSPARRDALIGQMAATFALMAQQPDADPRIVEMVERYLPPDFDPMQAFTDDDGGKEQMKDIVRRIPGRQKFFAEAMSLAFAMEYPDPAAAATLTQLTDLTLFAAPPPADPGQPPAEPVIAENPADARTAHATVHLQAGEKTTQDQWTFEKHGESWYLSMQ